MPALPLRVLPLLLRLAVGCPIDQHSPITRFVGTRMFIRPGDTVLDVGANLGYFSGYFASLTGPGGNVISFEPNPIVRRILQRSVRRRRVRAISVCEHAVSDVSGQVLSLQINPLTFGDNSTLNPDLKNRERMGWPVLEVKVRTLALDDLLQGDRLVFRGQSMPLPSFLKVDAEGNDLAVLQGATRILERARPFVMVEYGFDPAMPRWQHIQVLRERGYVCYEMDRFTPFTLEAELGLTQFVLTDILAIPQEKLTREHEQGLAGLSAVFTS